MRRRPDGRNDFPSCGTCPYVNPGHWSICYWCAYEQLVTIADPCPICAQERRGKSCRNWLCVADPDDRYIDGIEAITLHQAPLEGVVKRYKYLDQAGWAVIFARLLVGHLELGWSTRPVDLIVANPPSPSRDHITRVLQLAALADITRSWPFDLPSDPAIIKNTDTPQSAGQNFVGKRDAARAHGQALEIRHPERVDGKRIIIYDDICTTGLQLNEVARRLREWGAASVHGVVLARQPWTY